MSRLVERVAVFDSDFREDLMYWIKTDRRAALRTLELVDAILSVPFEGIGKPEPLRFALTDCWSRRITREHRLVYRVYEDRVVFLQARFHYE
jgi:toxin YoeB